MTKAESLYFDFVRVVAAMVVLIGHVAVIMPGTLNFYDLGHYAVVSFFVLSGYVISYVSDTKERTGTAYFISRAARVYSVALPAIALTIVLDMIGRHGINHQIYNNFPHSWPPMRALVSATFTNEVWFNSLILFTNGPYWSLCYEVWYYAIFGAAVYLKGRARLVSVACLLAAAGPKMLLLFPIWLLGVALYRYKAVFSRSVGIALFLASSIAVVVLTHSSLAFLIGEWMSGTLGAHNFALLEFSGDFLTDYIFACLIALNFIAARSFEGLISTDGRLGAVIRWAAGSTFSLYLFHRPLVVFLIAVTGVRPTTVSSLILISATVILAVALSYLTERRKQFWRKMVGLLLSGALDHSFESSRSGPALPGYPKTDVSRELLRGQANPGGRHPEAAN
ncbi:MAG TPA: acyltransferase [Rhizomicrobium sp.]|nr:acyltransferase [Rhizomicrobium sp.]